MAPWIWVRVSTAQAPDPGGSLQGISDDHRGTSPSASRAEDALQEARDALLRVARLSTMGGVVGIDRPTRVNQPLSAIVANGIALPAIAGRGDTPISKKPKRRVGDIVSDGRAREARCLPASVSWPKSPCRNGAPVDGKRRHFRGVVSHPTRAATEAKLARGPSWIRILPSVLADRGPGAASRAQSRYEWNRGDAPGVKDRARVLGGHVRQLRRPPLSLSPSRIPGIGFWQ